MVAVSLVTKPKPTEELRGLVWGLTRAEEDEENADSRDTSGDEEPRPSTGASDEEEIAAKAANRFDIRRLIGGLMIFWALSKPTVPEPPETRGQGSGRIRRASAT